MKTAHQRKPQPPRKPAAAVTFSPLAFLKLQFFLHAGDTEVGGFGICQGHESLYVTDFQTVKQRTTAVSVEFDDQAVADHFDRHVDAGLSPQQFARLWIHTHPGESPDPSSVDEMTFQRVFGSCDWACMLIIGRTGRTYARVRFAAGPTGALLLPVTVDWSAWPQLLEDQQPNMGEILESWMDEYGSNVHPQQSIWDSPRRPFTLGNEEQPDRLLDLYERQMLQAELIDAYEQGWEEEVHDLCPH